MSAPEMVSADEARAMLEAYGYVTTPPWEYEPDGDGGFVIHAPEAAMSEVARVERGEDGSSETDAAMVCKAINDFGRLARTVLALSERLAAMEAERAAAKFYCYTPDGSWEEHDTEEGARECAELSLNHRRDEAADETGWSEDTALIEYGRLLPVARATMVDRQDAPEGSEHDYTCDYQLQPCAPTVDSDDEAAS